ncbi:hypothetical protein BJY04DRAFT_164855 [Aspergillus karnatakaensis]|uniref:bZIP transcription factor n=1 Tax=Aspergillus karnatakaensis TaxID=1810916 RepID=UPI003CCE0330
MSDNNLSQTLSARCFLPDGYAARAIPTPEKADGGSKRRGRPRIAASGDPSRTDRRTQVRYAQRTYRHKKEAMYRNMEHRVADLEESMSRISHSISEFYEMAIDSDLHITHPQLFQHLRHTVTETNRAAATNDDSPPRRTTESSTRANEDDVTSFGYMVVSPAEADRERAKPSRPSKRRRLHDQPVATTQELQLQIEHPLPGMLAQTYSFQETDPTRMLNRFCLEYIYRLFADPRSNPQEFYRVFRLVPCVKWKDKMGKYLFCLVRSGSGARLDIPALPFYCIGGAGTHYPETQDGKPVYPEKMRLPRRILGNVLGLLPGEDISISRDKLLELAGLDGVWMDSRDVVGYLTEKGVLDSSRSLSVGNSKRSLTLDIEGFFHSLLSSLVILGRSPGFRLCDVEAAFNRHLQVAST